MKITEKFKISELTWGQARVRKITQKRWLRAERISGSLKKYHKTGLTIKQRREKISITKERKRVIEKKPITKRIRRQVAQNFKADVPPYFVSIRAMTINPIITQKGLNLALLQGKRKIQIEENINLTAMQTEYIGLEMVEIPPIEDRKLNDMKIHIEVFLAYLRGGKKILRYYIF